ncbi:DoxX family protein [Oceanobacillus polygoni]|uniref:Membrane protein YphA (DoxX/SURF4 family) n=1 Tax=Oceanobacillus polygoni TaxID=1235259 RepID=A0A9X0Z2R3_9BACI|nr:DoxX family protein [Oceanobacillus polygoni]MBP2079846.1 putative membrane protein YphA (DoxX/SURF4 family) [Oceanobacillus polygoni]
MTKNEVGSVILRIVLGITFFIHGLDKFQAGIGNIAGYFDSLGIPGFLAYIVALIELVGGIALILGIGTKIISALIAIIMLGAIFTAKLSLGFLDGYELDTALLAISIYLILADRTPFSLDHQIAAKNK